MDAEHLLINRDRLLSHARRAEFTLHELARGFGKAACSERVAEQFEHSLSEGFAIRWRHE